MWGTDVFPQRRGVPIPMTALHFFSSPLRNLCTSTPTVNSSGIPHIFLGVRFCDAEYNVACQSSGPLEVVPGVKRGFTVSVAGHMV